MNNMENNRYLSEEELKKLIAMTEAEPLLHPPKEFQNDVLRQVRRKREYRKNIRLFSYSVKVFAASAAALAVMIAAPESIRSEDTVQEHMERKSGMQEAASRTDDENFIYQLNEKMNDYCSQLNGKLNQLLRMEDN
ncbi:MAG: hypothetical protein NC321_07090 [Clostridium sp.]|nr:hypothetical protein [Lachnoclostridium sp.]MCM1252569.1 hypothetical protein [Clostridium sp.]